MGQGIRIEDGAKNITIAGLISEKMWGDGFYMQDAEDVRFCGVTADANRRQGLSIIDANGLLVVNSTFKNTHGTRPSAGIDLEPDKNAQKIANVRIENSKFFDNAGGGIPGRSEGAGFHGGDDTQHIQGQSPLRGRERPRRRRRDLRQPADEREAETSGGVMPTPN